MLSAMRRSPRWRAASVLAALLTATLVLVGCGPRPEATPGGVVRVGMYEPTLAISPDNASDELVARILPALSAGLVTVLPDGSVDLELAASIETTDNLVFDVAIDLRAAFADGTPVTSAAFVDRWQTLAMVDSGSPQRDAFQAVKGYAAEPEADASPTDDAPTGDLVAAGGLTIVDEAHFRITLSSPRPEFLAELTRPAFLPALPGEDPDATVATGAGPYRVVSAREGDRLDLEPNPGYVGPRAPANSGVSVRWFTDPEVALAELVAGQLDAVDRVPSGDRSRWDEVLDKRIVSHLLPVLYSLVLPSEMSRLRGEEGDLRVEALSLAIDRTAIAEGILDGGLPATDFMPVSVPAPGVPVGWLDRANDINAKRRWFEADEFGVWNPTFTIAVVDGGTEEAIAEALADRFQAALGIETIVLRFSSAAELDAAVEHDDLIVFRIRRSTAASPQVMDTLQRSLAGQVPRNVRKELAAASKERDPAEAARLAAMSQRLLAADPPILPLASPSVFAAYGPSVHGVQLEWRGALDLTSISPDNE